LVVLEAIPVVALQPAVHRGYPHVSVTILGDCLDALIVKTISNRDSLNTNRLPLGIQRRWHKKIE
jgi:hypothetical protein